MWIWGRGTQFSLQQFWLNALHIWLLAKFCLLCFKTMVQIFIPTRSFFLLLISGFLVVIYFFSYVIWTFESLSARKWRWLDFMLEVIQIHRTLLTSSRYCIRKATVAVCSELIALRSWKYIESSCIAIVIIYFLGDKGLKEVVAVGMLRG